MDFRFSFPLPCMLVILTITDGVTCMDLKQLFGDAGANVSFPLEIKNRSGILVMKETNCSKPENFTMDCCNECDKRLCLRNGIVEMTNLSENDEGKYTFAFGNDSEIFLLKVCEKPPAVYINCLPDGRANLSCEADGQFNDGVYWTRNGRIIHDVDACVKDGGKSIILGKGVQGKLACHRRNSCSSASIELSCNGGNDRDLLQHPHFLYIMVACGGGALLLAIIASLITCCCMKSKHHFTPVPAEDEKDEGITLSAISSEEPKSPPNGDPCETTDALVASTPNPGPETCESFKPEHKTDPNPTVQPKLALETKTEEDVETAFREVMVDTEALETVDDCFPDPIDA
ncbi:uncharacterized protein LOC128412892 [Podarcis raffonei]|uniref:uncharacterized protein LOC128412892 n=1 Tax=Podarcis raffonei TaxID=65483 RepID=UPI0023292E9F|nr:uncharacterized protein LOC128412892 [Podarcis raffonei]